jgi:hypothetical protein
MSCKIMISSDDPEDADLVPDASSSEEPDDSDSASDAWSSGES